MKLAISSCLNCRGLHLGLKQKAIYHQLQFRIENCFTSGQLRSRTLDAI